MPDIRFRTTFASLSLRSTMRLGARYRYFIDELDATVFKAGKVPQNKVSDLIQPLHKTILQKGRLARPRTLVELEDVESKTSSLLSKKLVTKINDNKLEFGEADILFSKINPQLGKILLGRKDRRDWIGSTEWVPLRLNRERMHPAFLKYLLLNAKVLQAFNLLKSGKAQARLPVDELLHLKIPTPRLTPNQQSRIEYGLLKIDRQIDRLSQGIQPVESICDKIFLRLYGLDKATVPVHTFATRFSEVSSTRLMRIGFRHSALAIRVKKILDGISDLISLASIATVRGGKRLEKGSGYSAKPTGYRYLRNLDILDGEIRVDSVRFISRDQHLSVRNYQVFPNEIVMAIAGTVGKVAIVPKELGLCNVTENLAVIHPKSVEPEYLFDILNSSIVQVQIQKEMSELRQQKLGLGKVRRLEIPKPPSRRERTRIVRSISSEIRLMKRRKIRVNDLLSKAVTDVERYCT